MLQYFRATAGIARRLLLTNVRVFSKHHDSGDGSAPNPADSKPELTYQNAQQTIEEWVKNNDICLFMKGTLKEPQCGYSNFVVETLKNFGLSSYFHVNVLDNEVVRSEVKKYSDWPTYPQLYIKGTLVGGADILNQMNKDGSLEKLLSENKLV